MAAKFSLGQCVATPGALEALQEAGQAPQHFLGRHVSGDWGELCPEDRKANEQAIAHEGDAGRRQRVVSAYLTTANARLWVITEWDRSVTTILLPDQY